jgi:hypothetical protein
MQGGYALEGLRLEKPEARKSEMNQDHQIWRTYEDRWISDVGHADHVTNKTTSRQIMSAVYVSKDTWHSRRMTSVKLKSTFQVRANHESE